AAAMVGGGSREDFSKPGPLGDRLYSLVVSSPLYDGVVPVGALGVPARSLWHLAASMLQPKHDSVGSLADTITGLSRRYSDSMQQAMSNQYLWRNAAGPVDVGSFEIAALVINACRAFGRGEVRDVVGRIATIEASPL